MKNNKVLSVEEYIANAPKDVQKKLHELRAIILKAVPGAVERTDYFQMPGYSDEGYDYYGGMFVWFSYQKTFVRLHVYPEVIQNNKKELTGYPLTKAIISFPADKKLPQVLVKKLVNESRKVMKREEKRSRITRKVKK